MSFIFKASHYFYFSQKAYDDISLLHYKIIAAFIDYEEPLAGKCYLRCLRRFQSD